MPLRLIGAEEGDYTLHFLRIPVTEACWNTVAVSWCHRDMLVFTVLLGAFDAYVHVRNRAPVSDLRNALHGVWHRPILRSAFVWKRSRKFAVHGATTGLS